MVGYWAHNPETTFKSFVRNQNENDSGDDILSIDNNIDIEGFINEDIKTINNAGGKTLRERALKDYFLHPNYCKHCRKMIMPKIGQSVHDIKRKTFCDASCAAQYNNNIRANVKTGPTSIIDSCTDDDFIKLYNNSDSYNQLGLAIGYSYLNSNIKNKIKCRIQKLGLEEYEVKNKLVMSTMTKGELINRRSNWQSWRSDIQQNARTTYQKNEKPNYCIVCGYDKTYEVAHIKAVSDFSDDALISEINDISNLVALCPNHHWEFDHGQLDLNEYMI